MPSKTNIFIALASAFLLLVAGCSAAGRSGGGWVVKETPASKPPPAAVKDKDSGVGRNTGGQERAARNQIKSAYRFLEKGKPDHAIRELEKARNRMGANFWFHYYMGGAYYFKGMYGRAGESWDNAYRFTGDFRLRSRLRTCQSFAVYRLGGDEKSIGLLKTALDMDRDNRQAMELIRDLDFSADSPVDGRSMVRGGHQGSSGKVQDMALMHSNENSQKQGDDTSHKHGGSGHKNEGKRGDPAQGVPDGKKGAVRKIQEEERFRAYFLVEME